MNEETKDIQFLRYFLEMIVADKSAIEIERKIDDLGVLILLKVAKDDMGKIIGKQGQTAKSLRILLRIIGAQSDERINLKIVDPEGEDDTTEAFAG